MSEPPATSPTRNNVTIDTSTPLASRPTSSAGVSMPSTPLSNGPMNRSWEPPPRAKPGRKPMNDNPIDKRKTQNRASQRAFRERKAEQIRKAETDAKDFKIVNAELRQQLHVLQERCSLLESQSNPLHDRIRQQDQELTTLRQELKDTQERLSSIDGSRHVEPSQVQEVFPSSLPVSPPASLTMSGGCGRCNDSGRCPCVDDYIQDDVPAKPIRSPSPHASRSTSGSTALAPTPVDFTSFGKGDKPQKSGPGTCARCQTDPNQRKWCLTLARESRPAQSPAKSPKPPRRIEIPNDLDSRQYVRCSEAYPILTKSDQSSKLQNSDWMRTVMTRTSEENESHSPMEVEMASALTALSRHGS